MSTHSAYAHSASTPLVAAHVVSAHSGSGHNVFGLTDRQLADFVTVPVRIVVILVVALVLRFVVGRTINRIVRSTREGRVSRRLHALGEHTPLLVVDTSAAAVERRRARAATLGTVLKSLANFVIFSIATITILGEVGINLAPIIAGAGIIGVAVGFGAQNLVKDFLSGLFLVIEDTYSVGDVVDLGPATGIVEWIGLRSTRIRDVKGTLWSIRNGEIARVGNYSQLWQRALFDVLIVHGADVDRARTAMLEAAKAVATDERWEGVALEEPAVWGVNEVRDTGIVLRLALKRRNGHDDFDRALRERIVTELDAIRVRQFPVATVVMTEPAPLEPAPQPTPQPASRRRAKVVKD